MLTAWNAIMNSPEAVELRRADKASERRLLLRQFGKTTAEKCHLDAVTPIQPVPRRQSAHSRFGLPLVSSGADTANGEKAETDFKQRGMSTGHAL